QKCDISEQQHHRLACNERRLSLAKGLQDLDKLLRSKKDVFDAGRNGLQARRARAMSSCLHMVLEHNRGLVEASLRAAECHGFSPKWGSRQVHQWVNIWVGHRELPASKRGHHIKTWTLLNEPLVVQELASFMRSEKWCMDPKKLANLTMNKLVPEVAKPYLKHLVEEEMPKGLKKYVKLELFPRIHYRAGTKGIANDGKKKGWLKDGENPLRKKGQGRGIHQSDVICSTVGWLKDASQTLEYGKNYDGYWTGEMFVKQLKDKIIPAFEKAHGPGYQAIVAVDNSQGHSAYSIDALLVSHMNLNPGGKQATMRDGWFIHNNQRVTQSMVFPPTHPKYPNLPKGMKERYLRKNCNYTFET
ncbi:hypothetical protein C8Q75DRAFT_707205, partial [Abortiporus biennis]